MFFTDDMERILIGLIPARRRTGGGKIAAQLREYRERGRVSFGRGDHAGVVEDIVIREVPERDWPVLAKYL